MEKYVMFNLNNTVQPHKQYVMFTSDNNDNVQWLKICNVQFL